MYVCMYVRMYVCIAYLIFNFVGDLKNMNQLIKDKIISIKQYFISNVKITY